MYVHVHTSTEKLLVLFTEGSEHRREGGKRREQVLTPTKGPEARVEGVNLQLPFPVERVPLHQFQGLCRYLLRKHKQTKTQTQTNFQMVKYIHKIKLLIVYMYIHAYHTNIRMTCV